MNIETEYPIDNESIVQEEDILDSEVVEPEIIDDSQIETQTFPIDSVSDSEWKDRYLRMTADFDNFKKRTQREKELWIRQAHQDLLRSLLPVFDDLNRSLKASETSDNIEAIRDGMRLVRKKMQTTLEKQGVIAMDAIGQPFDSEIHEALAQIPAPSEEQRGKVLEVVEAGYLHHDTVLRCAKVIIGE